MKKKKWNYAVMRSIFGDLWVGKTKLSVKKDKVFSNISDATLKAEMIFEDYHPDFDLEDEDNNELHLQDQYERLSLLPEEAEEITKGMGKHII